MDKSYVDISVLNKKVDFFIEPFEWINPQKIIGFSKSDVRKENIRLYEENEKIVTAMSFFTSGHMPRRTAPKKSLPKTER